MATDDREQRADALEADIREHDRRYWIDHAPSIPDEVYDRLVEALRALRPDSPLLHRVGAGAAELAATSEATGRVRHPAPMLSLEKCYSEPEIRRWFSRFQGPAAVSPKVDGVALRIVYDDHGTLALAATRGTGTEGDNVTTNVRTIAGVPHRLPADVHPGPLEVRGEVYLPVPRFLAVYADQFANPRNLAAGALKQKDPARCAAYGLHFAAYDVLGSALPTESAKADLLSRLGFEAAWDATVDVEGAQRAWERIRDRRDELPYETDGVVFRVDDVTQHERMGMTAHHPRWAIAYKFQGDTGETTLCGILWSVSRTGAINPIAVVEPVALSGVTVTRISLHNLAIMEKLGTPPLTPGRVESAALSAGARVWVTRRGGVIPHLESVAVPGSSGIDIPTLCPSCGAPTRRVEDVLQADHLPDCASQVRRQVLHYLAVMDILGIGPRLLDQLFDQGLVQGIPDLYRLRAEDLSRLERMGTRSAANVLAAIESRRRVPWPRFLAALGLPDVGTTVAALLGRHFADMQALRQASPESLIAIDGIGPVMAPRIVEALQRQALLIDAMAALLDLEAPEAEAPPQNPAGPFAGEVVVFTGALESMQRREAQTLVREGGGTTADAVGPSTTLLVIPDADFATLDTPQASRKLQAARQRIERGQRLSILPESAFVARARP